MDTNLGLVPYKQKALSSGEFGNSYLKGLFKQAALEEEASRALQIAGEAKQYLGFEMTRAILDLATRTKDKKGGVDPYLIFGEKKDVERLNTAILINIGVMKKRIDDETDEVIYEWTDEDVKSLYFFNADMKKDDEAEYNRRFNNRKRLNARLSDACKAATALLDQNLSAADLTYTDNKETGEKDLPTIKNAPKELGGEVGTIQLGGKKAVKGASLSPTMTSLVALAKKRHGGKGDRTDKGETRPPEENMGLPDEEFGKIVNTLRKAILAQEGQFTKTVLKHLSGLYEVLAPIVGGDAEDEAEDEAA